MILDNQLTPPYYLTCEINFSIEIVVFLFCLLIYFAKEGIDFIIVCENVLLIVTLWKKSDQEISKSSMVHKCKLYRFKVEISEFACIELMDEVFDICI
jgi:hypothetical protein